jgi:hypothetical protein
MALSKTLTDTPLVSFGVGRSRDSTSRVRPFAETEELVFISTPFSVTTAHFSVALEDSSASARPDGVDFEFLGGSWSLQCSLLPNNLNSETSIRGRLSIQGHSDPIHQYLLQRAHFAMSIHARITFGEPCCSLTVVRTSCLCTRTRYRTGIKPSSTPCWS